MSSGGAAEAIASAPYVAGVSEAEAVKAVTAAEVVGSMHENHRWMCAEKRF